MTKQTEQGFVIYFLNEKKFLCGTSRNRKMGLLDTARIFTRKAHADLSRTEAQTYLAAECIVIPIEITLDPKNLFLGILKGV